MSPKAIAHSEHLLVPVTALCLQGDLVLSGQGPFLKIYDHKGSSQLASCKIFVEQAVHGITVAHLAHDHINLVVYGGRHVRLVTLHVDASVKSIYRITTGSLQQCSDWISYLIIVPLEGHADSNKIEAVAITAHNALVGFLFDCRHDLAQSGGSVTMIPMTAATRCMIYTATMAWISPGTLLIVSGTAFGEIIAWTCHIGTVCGERIHKLQIHYSFSAHDGSIFGLDIDISRSASASSPPRALVASCSDDRTLRLWDVSSVLSDPWSDGHVNELKKDLPEDIPKPIPNAATLNEIENRLKASPRQIAKAWAHSSRIWHVKFIHDPNPAPGPLSCRVVTFGEDAAYHIWRLHTSANNTSYSLDNVTLVDTFTGHAGKNIWSFAINLADSGIGTVVTGGADGRIVLITPKIHGSRSANSTRSFTAAELCEGICARGSTPDVVPSDTAVPPSINKLKDNIKSYCFVGSEQILLTTANGLVLCVDFCSATSSANQDGFPQVDSTESQTESAWNMSLIAREPSLSSFSVLAGNNDLGIAFIGDSSGQIFSYINDRNLLSCFANVGTKVAALFLHVTPSQSQTPSFRKFHLLVTQMADQVATLFECRQDRGHENLSLAITSERKIAFPPQFVVTAMTCLDFEHSSIILGSRDGRILIFPLTTASCDEDPPTSRGDVLTLEKYNQVGQHADAVTSVLWKTNMFIEDTHMFSAKNVRTAHILTTARDSSYAIHKISIATERVKSEKLHSTTLPFGPNIEGAVEYPEEGSLAFYGFDSKYFVEYSEQYCIESLRVECGGAHRVWAYQPRGYDLSQRSTFVWTKASRLASFSRKEPKARVIKHGGHGREIKSCALQPTVDLSSPRPRLLATGAEDTDIRLFRYRQDDRLLTSRCLSEIKKHNTGIQQLKWSDHGKYLFSCGGCEEFFVWRIRELAGSFVEIGVLFESAMPLSSELPDLRIMDFDVRRCGFEASEEGDHPGEDVFTIFMVFSDSTMRHFKYFSGSKSWQLLKTGAYRSCCLTSALYLDTSSELVLVGATDGTLSVWNSEGQGDEIQRVLCTRVHQNAIKDIAVVDSDPKSSGSNSTCWVFCVGDDNALSVTRFDCEQDLHSVKSSTLIIRKAHYAAATALTVLSVVRHANSASVDIRLATAGNDQRVRVWDFCCDAAQPSVEGVSASRAVNFASAIADAACMASFGDNVSSKGEKVETNGEEVERGQRLLVCGVGTEVIAVR